MDSFTLLLILIGLGALSGVALKVTRGRLHARMEALRIRLGLTETVWEEKGLMSLLTGRKGTTQFTLAARPWGPLQVRASIPATLPLGLSLTPQGNRTSLRGMQDIQVGIPDLDSHFQVQGEHPAATIRYLREERTQKALRNLLAADPQAAVIHGEVRLNLANLATPGQFESAVRLVELTARELAEATGAPVLPAATPEPPPAPPRSNSPQPFVTAVVEGGLIRPRFSPGYLAVIQREYRFRRMLLRCLYAVSAGWVTVLVSDRYFQASILFDLPRRHPTWRYIWILSLVVIIGTRLLLRRCPSCSAPIGEGYGVTRVVATHSITCTNCSIELQ
jgi:hypothetical protein